MRTGSIGDYARRLIALRRVNQIKVPASSVVIRLMMETQERPASMTIALAASRGPNARPSSHCTKGSVRFMSGPH